MRDNLDSGWHQLMSVVSELALALLTILSGETLDEFDARDHLPRDHLILGVVEEHLKAGIHLPLCFLTLQVISLIAEKVECVWGQHAFDCNSQAHCQE